MDNLSRTRDDLKLLSINFLKALKTELEESGTKCLTQLDQVESDNKKLLLCLRNLKFIPKEVKEQQKKERAI